VRKPSNIRHETVDLLNELLQSYQNAHYIVIGGDINEDLERDMTLCGDNWLYEEASFKKSGSSLLNSARKQ
jgi:hypothetical protein